MKKIISKFINCRKWTLLVILFASILASFAFVIVFGGVGPSQHAVPGTDYFNCYKPFAQSIIAGNWIFLDKGSVVCAAPGYPLFIAVILQISNFLNIGELELILVFNIIITALSCCLLFLLADFLFGRKTAIVAAFLWMTYPFNLWFIKNPNTEIVFILLLLFSTWLYLSSLKKGGLKLLSLAGFIMGLNILFRPIALFLPFLFAIFIFFIERDKALSKKILLVIVFLLFALIPVSFWETAISSATGQFILLSSGGPSSIVDGLTFALKSGAGGDKVDVPADVLALMERANDSNLNSVSKIAKFLWGETIHNTGGFLKLICLKLIRSWYATSQKWWEGKILLVQFLYLIPSFFGFVYIWKKCREKKREILLLLAIILYSWFMTVVALSIMRYMIPAMALIIIFFAVTANLLITYLHKKIRKDEVGKIS